MKLGIVGAGMIVNDFFKFYKEVDNLEVNAICGVPAEEEKLIVNCKEHNIPKYYLNYTEMLSDENVDTIYVAVPNHLHYIFSKQALENGKNVLCEKPFTSNYDEAKELIDYAKEKDLFIFDAITSAFLPNVQEIKTNLSYLGDIKIVFMNYSHYSSRYDKFKNGEILPAFDSKKCGGALMDLNIYNINLALYLFGEPKSIDYQANIMNDIDTSGILSLDYGTFKCVCIAAKDCSAPATVTIQGDKGYIIAPDYSNFMNEYSIILNNGEKTLAQNKNGGKHRMYYEFVEFAKLLETNNKEEAQRLNKVTLIAQKLQTTARVNAGIKFPCDK